jgi:hypothetical protein
LGELLDHLERSTELGVLHLGSGSVLSFHFSPDLLFATLQTRPRSSSDAPKADFRAEEHRVAEKAAGRAGLLGA